MVNTESHYSSHSELESSYSDSDWLDIPSSHVSEDNDSVAGFDDYSDREGIDRPSSRRSFSSLASSREGVVDGWEGLIEDSADDATPNDHDAFVDPITSAEISVDDPSHTSIAQDEQEDERVKAIADKHGRTSAQILLNWNASRGNVVLPKSMNPSRIESNAQIFDFALDDHDRESLEALGKEAYCTGSLHLSD